MAKKMDRQHDAEVRASSAAARQAAGAGQPPEMKRKEYEREMRVLHAELVAMQDDKKRGRLNIISHLLSQVPYKPLAHRDITLPKRQRSGGYAEPDLLLRYIPTPF